MPAIGNASNFAARGVPPPKAPAPSHTNYVASSQSISRSNSGRPDTARTYVPDVRPHGSGTLTKTAAAPARPASAYGPSKVAPLAAKITPSRLSSSPKGSAALSQTQRLAQLVPIMTRGAVADPFSPIAANGPVMTAPLQQLEFQGQFNQDFQRLQQAGLLPKGAQQPPLTFVSGGPDGPLDARSYEEGSGPNARIFITPQTLTASEAPEGLLRTWGLQTPIHELAHALQTQQALSNIPLREGGAQAFADAAAVPALGPIAPANDTNYSKYVEMVRRLGPRYFMQQQFQGR